MAASCRWPWDSPKEGLLSWMHGLLWLMPLSKKICRVTLINLGGPRNADEIEAFLKDLLTDPLMVDMPLPYFLQKRLMSFVAKRRAPKVLHKYQSMGFGGASPLVSETQRQADALRKELERQSLDTDWQIEIAMACGFPNLREKTKESLIPSKDNILLPLYPQFSRSTTLSTAHIIRDKTATNPLHQAGFIGPFFDDPRYIDAIASLIHDFINNKIKEEKIGDFFINPDEPPKKATKSAVLLFSAHGIPLRLVKKGDPYPAQIEKNADLLYEALQKRGFAGEMHLSYQSRLGPGKWTSPSTIDKLRELGQAGHKTVLVYPISFVSDHLETLEEIQTELRQVAQESGIQNFHRIPAPGTYPPFISFLAKRILEEANPAQKG